MFFLTLSQWFLEKIYLDSSASVVIETLSMNYKDNDVLEYFRTSVSGKGSKVYSESCQKYYRSFFKNS